MELKDIGKYLRARFILVVSNHKEKKRLAFLNNDFD
jgi:hypothetical protein